MGKPVICTNHPNQRAIIEQGIFIDMATPGALTAALRDTPRAQLHELGMRGREVAVREYDLRILRQRYVDQYRLIAAATTQLPQFTTGKQIGAHARNLLKRARNAM